MKALALAVCLAVCATSAIAAGSPAKLSKAEQAAGWRLLFDGRTTAGWRGFKTAAPDAGWTAKNGVLAPDPATSRDIMTKDIFGNFELSFEWQISPKGNSGVMFHVVETGDETYESGPEYQLLDNARGEPPLEQAGGLFALYAPSMDMTKPVGEFNQSRIAAHLGHVQHWLNGMMVAEYDIGSPDFKARVAASKFKQWPQFASAATGHIALQNHGNAVAFRNIKVRVLK